MGSSVVLLLTLPRISSVIWLKSIETWSVIAKWQLYQTNCYVLHSSSKSELWTDVGSWNGNKFSNSSTNMHVSQASCIHLTFVFICIRFCPLEHYLRKQILQHLNSDTSHFVSHASSFSEYSGVLKECDLLFLDSFAKSWIGEANNTLSE